MIRRGRISCWHCVCDLCGYKWDSIAKEPPEACANHVCHSREWNGKKVHAPRPVIKLPKPRKVRHAACE
jgi:hypothetical protein